MVRKEGVDPFLLEKMSNHYMPKKFYRYRSFNENNKDALLLGYEWMSYPDEYNDPFDARLFYSHQDFSDYVFNGVFVSRANPRILKLIRKLIGVKDIDLGAGRIDRQLEVASKRKHGKVVSAAKDMIRDVGSMARDFSGNLVRELDERVRRSSLICSFSTSLSNELMWAHYSDSHKGYCLEYGCPEIIPENGGLFLPVVYREEPLDVTKAMKDSFPDGKGAGNAVIASAIVKSSKWEYEDEWRYCVLCQEENRHLRAFEPQRLLLGCKAQKNVRNELAEICRDKGLPMYQMQRSSTSFSIVEGERIV
ncbi:DUF2971 domain-containing protein [Bisbaumannia pacifica]|uniref:DUF2971 domain-containing protein n=1 Tax=Bisbaumannia pacifica TaxID=77098 RepID=UPI001FD61EBC|nr:DUF2971 domain-containing protein [Halomonas pacifica]